MSRVKNRNTRQELVVRSVLHRLGFRFRLHRSDLPGTPDIVLPKFRVVVFVNGCFWHGHECPRGKLPNKNRDFWRAKIAKNQRRDQTNYRKLDEMGWTVLLVWGCELSSRERIIATAHHLKRRILAV